MIYAPVSSPHLVTNVGAGEVGELICLGRSPFLQAVAKVDVASVCHILKRAVETVGSD
jgi:hypothetical protein